MLTPKEIRSGLKISIIEGAFAHIYANLTGSIFLPSFAILLLASDLEIGILAAIPFFGTIAQIFGSVLVEKFGNRKKIAIFFAYCSRLLWLPIILITLFSFNDEPVFLLQVLILIILIHHLLGALSGVAWLSWMSNLVPHIIRGRFFGLRNSVLGTVTIFITLSAGYFLDWYHQQFPASLKAMPFVILFILAVIAGMVSATLLFRQADSGQLASQTSSLKDTFHQPFRHTEFKTMLRFALIWQFAVNFASPFFVVYMIKDLALSYTLVSIMTILSALTDLAGMGFWGHFSDRHGNRPVILISAAGGTLLPFLWIFTNSSIFSVYYFIPLLHLAGGFFFAGYNLCSVNMLFSKVPPKKNSAYFAIWSTVNGFAAGLAAISGGFVSGQMESVLDHLPWQIDSVFKIIFLISTLLRFSSLFFMRKIREQHGTPVIKAVRILRSVRVWATTLGYHPLLQFFLPQSKTANGSEAEDDYWPLWRRFKYLKDTRD